VIVVARVIKWACVVGFIANTLALVIWASDMRPITVATFAVNSVALAIQVFTWHVLLASEQRHRAFRAGWGK